MAAAALLTALALLGVAGGVLLHRGELSKYLSAVGGLLLLLVAFVWLGPEIASQLGLPAAVLCVGGAACLLALADHFLSHSGHSLVLPLLAATMVHSLLDGWSIRALASHPVPFGLVPAGLALHKIPEGLALGWVLRRATPSHARAFCLGAAAEAFTLVGALLQPWTDRVGIEHFGPSWTAAVLCIIAGAFVFVGAHALVPLVRPKP